MSVRDEDFELFIEEFGEATHTDKVPESSIQKYKGILPDQLLHYWKTEGWSAYNRNNGQPYVHNQKSSDCHLHKLLKYNR